MNIILLASLLLNILLIGVILLQFVNIRKNASTAISRDSLIKDLNIQLTQARHEINRKETVILREKGKGHFSIQFFIEESLDDAYFSKKRVVKYRSQIYLNGFPVGAPSTMREDVYKTIDKEQVNRVLNDFAVPLIKMGLQASVNNYGLIG